MVLEEYDQQNDDIPDPLKRLSKLILRAFYAYDHCLSKFLNTNNFENATTKINTQPNLIIYSRIFQVGHSSNRTMSLSCNFSTK